MSNGATESVPEPHAPRYDGHGTASIVPALTWGTPTPLIPEEVVRSERIVLLVIDSLGWVQLAERPEVAPTLTALSGGPATTTAPSTTATALTTISTGAAPGEHGIVGYRFPAGGAVMNALRWTSPAGDHRSTVAPRDAQPLPPLAGGDWQIVSDRNFIGSGFTEAYLGDIPYRGIWHPSSLVAGVEEQLAAGAKRVYTYYDGLDHTAHVHGFSGTFFDRELAFCDWLVATMIDALPADTALVVTADHGQIDAPEIVAVNRECLSLCSMRSGEARFRWLHAKPGAADDLLETAQDAHGDIAWVRSLEQVLDEGWFGPSVTEQARHRLGDVALVPHAPVGFDDPAERHLERLVGRHGSLTEAEMLVPVLYFAETSARIAT